ncbi:MAG TPA: tetratricopeptide repeat protein [Bryobacterales bacterium]|nr:tetratricopeptide repeat protein [Bryobacterales bacterium]
MQKPANRLGAWRLFRRAQAWHARGACGKAAALYQQALSANPRDRGAWLWRGLALAEQGRFTEAREHVEKGMALASDAAAGRMFLARVLYDAGEAREAQSILGESAQAGNQQARGLLALCLLRGGEMEKARAILAGPLPCTPWLLARLLAAIEEKIGIQPPEPPAEIGPEPAVGSAPPGWLARRRRAGHLRRGLVAIRAEKWEKALAAFRKAERVAAGHPRAAYGSGVALYYLGHFEESRRRLREALDHLDEPFSSDAVATLGKVALEMGETKEALLLLRRGIARGAAMLENYYALGLAALRLGRPALARRAFEKCASPAFIQQRLEEMA